MKIQRLKLRNFRNYANISVELHPGLNLITGDNGQGKTNLLESLVYLSLTRSHRILDDKYLIREDCSFADIQCLFTDERQKEIEAVIHDRGKTLMVNKQSVSKSSEFIGLLNVVLFAPDDLRMFNDQPKERRRLLNQEITKISPKYLMALNRYQNLLKERNVLLKEKYIDERLLDILDEQMIIEEEVIIHHRLEFVSYIARYLPVIYRRLSDSDTPVHLSYKTCIDLNEESMNLALRNMYRQAREKDKEYHMTTCGIHRDDIIFPDCFPGTEENGDVVI